MERVKIPESDLVVSKAVFGTSRLGGTVSHYDKSEAQAILRTAMEGGVNCFDTADIYAQGNSERLLAETFSGCRDKVVIATKGGYVLSAKARILAKAKPLVRKFLGRGKGLAKAVGKARGGQMARDFSREHLTKALEASLRRLRTDRIDLYQLHSPSAEHLMVSGAFETLARFKETGKIRAFGASILAWEDLDRCFDHGVSWVQVEAGLLSESDRTHWIKKAADANVLLICRQVFDAGRVFGDPGELSGDSRRKLEVIRDLGDPSDVILRYLSHHAPFGAFLFATTRLDRLRANLDSLQRPELSASEATRLSERFNLPVSVPPANED
ncbi:aldo/keto reductase [Haloferula sp.]|uniref:aldo/keto reductase n=1 Tax=Haloferula sp. TaxID=2497595 RepID=UPI0032A00A76